MMLLLIKPVSLIVIDVFFAFFYYDKPHIQTTIVFVSGFAFKFKFCIYLVNRDKFHRYCRN